MVLFLFYQFLVSFIVANANKILFLSRVIDETIKTNGRIW